MKEGIMRLEDVICELFTNDSIYLIEKAIGLLTESDDFSISLPHLLSFLEDEQNLAFIARYEEEVLGFIYGYSLLSLTSLPQLFIYSVDVFKRYQGLGVGSKLFQYVVNYARQNGYSESFVITDKRNKPACRIYEKAGGKSYYDDEIVYVIKN